MQGLVKMDPDGAWAEDRQNPIYYLVKVAKVALPLYPQFGLEPNGYYIPPRCAPGRPPDGGQAQAGRRLERFRAKQGRVSWISH